MTNHHAEKVIGITCLLVVIATKLLLLHLQLLFCKYRHHED